MPLESMCRMDITIQARVGSFHLTWHSSSSVVYKYILLFGEVFKQVEPSTPWQQQVYKMTCFFFFKVHPDPFPV